MNRRALEIAILIAVVVAAPIVLALETTGLDLCSPLQATTPQAGAPALCYVEFWLNRYQALMAAGVAILAAFIAARPAWRQLQATERQLAALNGDLPPDIWIQSRFDLNVEHGALENGVLVVANRNRFPIRLKVIELIEPDIPILVYEYYDADDCSGGKSFIPGEGFGTNICHLDYGIAGASPADDNREGLIICFVDDGDLDRVGKDEPVRLAIEYDLIGSSVERHRVEISGFVRRANTGAVELSGPAPHPREGQTGYRAFPKF